MRKLSELGKAMADNLTKNPTVILTISIFTIYLIITYLNPIHKDTHIEGFSNNSNNKNSLNLYLFYTEDCPHSKKFLNDQWITLKKKYQSQIVFNEFNCKEESSKGICKRFQIKIVPAIFLIEDTTHLEFKGTRSLQRLQEFLDKNIKDHRENFNQSSSTDVIVSDDLPATTNEKIPCDAELSKVEDLDKEFYEYSIKYPKPYSQYNMTLNANLKKEKNIKPYQLAYTIIHEHIRRCGNNDLETMKEAAYKMKDKIAEWGLAQRELLEQIRKQNNSDEKNVTTAIMYAAGFE
uniref:Thioredoxin domain-containing protein n=1 Tax=viral metagenome TaxID=1070528 RepID=A0A6C0E7J3_9ZZZZ